jgi:hypothetical protein
MHELRWRSPVRGLQALCVRKLRRNSTPRPNQGDSVSSPKRLGKKGVRMLLALVTRSGGEMSGAPRQAAFRDNAAHPMRRAMRSHGHA